VVKKLSCYDGSTKVRIGIRPEDIKVTGRAGKNSVATNVDFVEVEGERNILSLQLGDGEIFLAETASDVRPELNSTLHVEFDMRHLHVFEEESGMNISY
jgi:ABC-type sugar transport system ATPase subunit